MATTITCVTGQGAAEVHPIEAFLPAPLRESARGEANGWIKRLRLVRYGGRAMRERFRYRDDSLWWFTELYLHKMRQLDLAVSTVLALDAARDRLSPTRVSIDTTSSVAREAAIAFGRARGLPVEVTGRLRTSNPERFSYLTALTARLSRLRPGGARRIWSGPRPDVAAFIHTAFWKISDGADGPDQESYIGPVLTAVGARLAPGRLACVGVGPRRNFRARRWWDPVIGAGGDRPLVIPVEALAPSRAMADSVALWERRDALADELTSGPDIRAAAEFRGCDLWPILREELRATALLQWPWSARAMDEAGAALDALSPGVVVTYAEAGGWGRALVLEARRRHVASVGVQHGFIYRHWLNYRHEPDEWIVEGLDRGVPAPDRTLVFDRYASEYLQAEGHFAPESLRVTGSARLDDLMRRLEPLARDHRREIREACGVGRDGSLVVLAAKLSEIASELPALVRAVASRPSLQLVVKTHPAETADPYRALSAGVTNVTVVPPDADLARLLAGADGLITMNSTVAIDAMALGVPALVVGLPNNLTPFVDAGVMLGADSAGIGPAIDRLLYDQEARETLGHRAAEFVERYGMRPDGRAAARAAGEVMALVPGDRRSSTLDA